MKIFIDTSAYLAIFVKNEIKHKEASSNFDEYVNNRYQFYTSYYVLNELYTRVIYTLGKVVLKKIINQIDTAIKAGELKVLDVDEVMFDKSTETMIKFAEHKLSFVDASIFNLVKDYKINEVFTLDSDFKKVGIKTSF